MNNKLSQLSSSADLQAREWVAKLDADDLSSADAEALRQWLGADPQNARHLARRLDDWSAMSVLSELTHLDLEAQIPGFFDRVKQFFRPRGALGYFAYSFSLLVILGVANFSGALYGSYSALFGREELIEINLTTAVGELVSESLPDGSTLHLNTKSTAEISFNRAERAVLLKDGEAFFEVAHDKDRPFVVYAGDTFIRAIGTAFDVQLQEEGKVSVSVTEGTVEFVSGGVSRLVSANTNNNTESSAPGNIALYDKSEIFVDMEVPEILDRRFAWQEGMLEFRGESLFYVVEELSRYTEAQIEIVDEDIRDVQLGGYFKIGDIAGLASTLELAFGIQVEIVSEDLIQLSRVSN